MQELDPGLESEHIFQQAIQIVQQHKEDLTYIIMIHGKNSDGEYHQFTYTDGKDQMLLGMAKILEKDIIDNFYNRTEK